MSAHVRREEETSGPLTISQSYFQHHGLAGVSQALRDLARGKFGGGAGGALHGATAEVTSHNPSFFRRLDEDETWHDRNSTLNSGVAAGPPRTGRLPNSRARAAIQAPQRG
jgi:hypothetical protein